MCGKDATYIRDFPTVDDSLYMCEGHMLLDDFQEDCYLLTPERIQEELKRQELLKLNVQSMKNVFKKKENKSWYQKIIDYLFDYN